MTPRTAPDAGSDHGVIDALASTGPPARECFSNTGLRASSPTAFAVGDFNGDGYGDVAVVASAGTGSTVGEFLRTPDATRKK